MKRVLFIRKITLIFAIALIAFGATCTIDQVVHASDYADWYIMLHSHSQILSPYFESAIISEEITIDDDGQKISQHLWYYTNHDLRQILAACEEAGVIRVVLGQHTCIGGSLTRITIDRQVLQDMVNSINADVNSDVTDTTPLAHRISYDDYSHSYDGRGLPDITEMRVNVVATNPAPAKTGPLALLHGFILGLAQRLMLRTGCTVRAACIIMGVVPCFTASAACFGMIMFMRRQRNTHPPRFLNLSGSL